MKRPRSENSASLDSKPPKKKGIKSNASDPEVPSPKRRAFNRDCKFDVGEKVIAFYGGWPYVGEITATSHVNMAFGATFIVLIRWSGFSGKNAMSWISEFDVLKHNEKGLKLKADMEEMQRQLIASSGGKPDIVKQRKIFLNVVMHFRGKRLSPLRPVSSPYPDEWQTIIRMFAIPKALVDHLKRTENLIFDRKLSLPSAGGIHTVWDVLSDWMKDDSLKMNYANLMRDLFNKWLFRILLYRIEIPEVYKVLVKSSHDGDYSKVAPIEYLLRLVGILPEIVTAGVEGSLGKNGGKEFIESLLELANAHQLFLSHIVLNIEPLLSAPIRRSALEESLPDDYAIDYFIRSVEDSTVPEPDALINISTKPGQGPRQRAKYKNKRKAFIPVQKLPSDDLCSTNIPDFI